MESPTSPNLPGNLDTPALIGEDLVQFDEAQLREIHENEEIERFLSLFSTYVNEVKASDAPNFPPSTFLHPEGPNNEGEQSDDTTTRVVIEDHLSHYNWISEEVAYRLLLPLLPPPRAPPPEFTLNRFRLASERVYLSIVPYYFPFFLSSYRLAKWQDRVKSSILCTGFWILWWQDLLPAAFLLILILVLLKRRFFPYPSRFELMRHREEVYRADRFSEQLSQRLLAPSVFGARDMWRFGKLFIFPPKKRTLVKMTFDSQHQAHVSPADISDPTVLEDTKDSEEIQEIKRLGLFLMNEIADLHERVKNVFIWRKPASSWMYLTLLTLLYLGTSLLPSKYVLKAFFATQGVVFWHVVPIVLALTPEDRLRLPPPLLDVPTDAEFAMELISQRVAAGLEINPGKLATDKAGSHECSRNPTAIEDQFPAQKSWAKVMTGHVKGVEKALDSGRFLLQGGKEIISRMQTTQSEDDAPSFKNLVSPPPATYTYLAQHSSTPGLITLTPTTFYFSPATSTNRRLTIPLQNIKGMKKSGIVKGLEFTWVEGTVNGCRIDRTEKFRWINKRDELFARVISANSSMKWTQVQ